MDTEHYSTGAKRDRETGKPRIDLIDRGFLVGLLTDTAETRSLHSCIIILVQKYPNFTPDDLVKTAVSALNLGSMSKFGMRLSEGAEHYGVNNWRSGIPCSRVWSSLLRHYVQYLEGNTDEDHISAVLCNLMFMYVYLTGDYPDEIKMLPLP